MLYFEVRQFLFLHFVAIKSCKIIYGAKAMKMNNRYYLHIFIIKNINILYIYGQKLYITIFYNYTTKSNIKKYFKI